MSRRKRANETEKDAMKTFKAKPEAGFTQEIVLRRIISASTALGFAAALGSAACVERGVNHGLAFRWHWSALAWMTLGVAAAYRLWHLVWLAQSDATGKARKRLVRYGALLTVGGLGVFVYPMVFVAREQFGDVLIGLIAAFAVLTFVGWMIYRVFQGFIRSDAADQAVNARDAKP
jgi:uncharacterized protein YfiM (DUF2279 family)